MSDVRLVFGITFLSVVCFFAESVYLFMHGTSFKVMQISIVLLSLACVMLFYNISYNNRGLLFVLRKLSFLIYVIHPLYIKLIPLALRYLRGTDIDYYWYLFPFAQIPIIIAASVITGLLLIKCAEKIKFLRKIM